MDLQLTCHPHHIQLQWTRLLSTRTCPEPPQVQHQVQASGIEVIWFCCGLTNKSGGKFFLAEAKAAEAAASSSVTFAPARVYLPEVSLKNLNNIWNKYFIQTQYNLIYKR